VRSNALLAFTLLLAAAMHAADRPTVAVEGPSAKRTFSEADLAKLPRVSISIMDHGKEATFEGTELRHMLAAVDVASGEKLRGKDLTSYVLIEAADGYRALFALPELDAAFTDRKTILADHRDGKPLSGAEGPFRVVVEGEKRLARSVRQVIRISVRVAQ
jgi:hypothetical protein